MGNSEPTPDDKPFDDEPFNAGVEADEESDPKKYIEQLTGKLGQSLRKYNEENGQPDLELEKFAINSLLSATHTSEMDDNDRDDIINKVNTAGNDDKSSEGSDSNSSNNGSDNNDGNNDGGNNEFGDFNQSNDNNDEEGLEEEKSQILEKDLDLDGTKLGSDLQIGDVLTGGKNGYSKIIDISDNGNVYVNVTTDEKGNYGLSNKTYQLKRDSLYGILKTIKETVDDSLFIEPKKMSIFAPKGSPEHMDENNPCWKGYEQIGMKEKNGKEVPNCVPINEKHLIPNKKSRIFDKNKIKSKLQETFNQNDMLEPEVKPIVKPDTAPTKPSRRNKPFLPMPEVEPDPKAVDEGKWGDMMKGVKGEPAESWTLVAIENNKVVGQDIDIKIQDAIPAHYEALKRQFPNSVIAVENGYGQIVWSDKKYKK